MPYPLYPYPLPGYRYPMTSTWPQWPAWNGMYPPARLAPGQLPGNATGPWQPRPRFNEAPPALQGSPQDPRDWKQGIRRPFGIMYSPAQIDEALKASQGQVKVERTPFPGTRLFYPGDGQPHPGIILLHGSDGGASGWNEHEAIEWVKKGFVVMAYAYFGAAGTPTGLANINLDTAMKAIQYLKTCTHVSGKKVGIYGVSRGAEMAVALASLFPQSGLISAVVAHSPQDRAQGSITVREDGMLDTVRDPSGRPLPGWAMGGKSIPTETPYPLERYQGPLFITHGTADEVWSVDGTRQLDKRLKAAGKNADIRYLAGEGHVLSVNTAAKIDAARLAFFKANLGR